MPTIEEYNIWLDDIISNNKQTAILDNVTNFEYSSGEKSGMFYIPSSFKARIPQEFIAGAFVWCNGKTYLNLNKDESSLDNLCFIPNENFYLNLSPERKSKIIRNE